MPIEPARIEKIFFEASAIAEVAARNAYLDQACDGNAALRERVDALLAAHDSATSFLELPGESDATTAAFVRLSEGPGSKIGRYKLLEEIGEGGFGVVFMAEQEEPVRRRVALKIIKAGMDTRQVVARFEAERQALAMMDHPNIARVFDAGATDTGRPYFVMELVKGIPLTTYCDQHKLGTDERLELFMAVCLAVQHAHQKGIIHRDLKPSNVMITLHDDKPVPKIIDFGIAKATQARLTEKTLFTEYRQLIGTPAYMSPEQAQMIGLDVDTRSDIYSLGVLLYELLTRTTPFDTKELLRSGYDEMRRIIREVEPPRPSTRLSTLASSGVLGTRGSEPSSDPKLLSQQLRGDLDWIVMKCLEKDRTRRYDSAGSLAADIERHLSDQPVEARRPTRVYRLKKFVRRNKVGVLAGSAVAIALVVGLALATTGFVQARRQAQIASAEAARSSQVALFLQEMLAGAGPSVALGRDASLLREILDQAGTRVDAGLDGYPEVQGDLWLTLGSTYYDIGDYMRAITMFQKAVDNFRVSSGIRSGKIALALTRLGSVQSRMGNVAAGKANAFQGVEIARQIRDPDNLADCLHFAAYALDTTGLMTQEGALLLRESLKIRESLGDRSPQTARSMRALASCIGDSDWQEFDPVQAESLIRAALAIDLEHYGRGHPTVAGDQFCLFGVLRSQGKTAEAADILQQSLDMQQELFGRDNPRLRFALRYYAELLTDLGRTDEAEAVVKAAVETSPSTAAFRAVLGSVYADHEKWPEAVEQLARAVDLAPEADDFRARYAVALVQSGAKAKYQQLRHDYLQRGEITSNIEFRLEIAKAFLILPVGGDDLDKVGRLADLAASWTDIERIENERPLVKAMIELRRGRFDRVEEHVHLCLTEKGKEYPVRKAQACYVKALALAKKGKVSSASEALRLGDTFLAQRHKKPRSPELWHWAQWVIAEHLRGEAAAVLGITDPPPKVQSALPVTGPAKQS